MHRLFGKKQNATHGKGWGKGYGLRAQRKRDKEFREFDIRDFLRGRR